MIAWRHVSSRRHLSNARPQWRAAMARIFEYWLA
jgi:hypothetical protein